jgi:nitronate monooxygenase
MPLPATLEGRRQLPAVGAPLCIVSSPELVIAKRKVGVVGGLR